MYKNALIIYSCFLAVMSIITFISYGTDKRKAKKKAYRTPEKVLLALSFFGGAFGGILGMGVFRHKTQIFQGCWGKSPCLFLSHTSFHCRFKVHFVKRKIRR